MWAQRSRAGETDKDAEKVKNKRATTSVSAVREQVARVSPARPNEVDEPTEDRMSQLDSAIGSPASHKADPQRLLAENEAQRLKRIAQDRFNKVAKKCAQLAEEEADLSARCARGEGKARTRGACSGTKGGRNRLACLFVFLVVLWFSCHFGRESGECCAAADSASFLGLDGQN